MRQQLKVDVARDGGQVIVRLQGDLDMAEIDRVTTTVNEVLEDGCETVVLDCALLTFLDVVGIGAIMRERRLAELRVARLRLRNLDAEPLMAMTAAALGHLVSDGDAPGTS